MITKFCFNWAKCEVDKHQFKPFLSENNSVSSKFLTLVVRLTISFILSLITQVNTTETSSDLSRKVWVTAYKSDAYWAVNL